VAIDQLVIAMESIQTNRCANCRMFSEPVHGFLPVAKALSQANDRD